MAVFSSEVMIDMLTVEGLTFEVTAELDYSKRPLVFVNVLDDTSALLSSQFVTDPDSLRQLATFLSLAADKAEVEFQMQSKSKIRKIKRTSL